MVVSSLDQESLEEIGIQNCDTVVVCIGEQMDISILTTMTVLNLKVPHVIAKANSLMHGEVLKRLGAKVVFPERDMAVRLGKGLIYNSFHRFCNVGGQYRGQKNTGNRSSDWRQHP